MHLFSWAKGFWASLGLMVGVLLASAPPAAAAVDMLPVLTSGTSGGDGLKLAASLSLVLSVLLSFAIGKYRARR